MKLRTRLALLSGAIILLAVLVCDAFIFRACRRALIDEAAMRGFQDSMEVFNAYDHYGESLGGRLEAYQALYFLKDRHDDLTILLENGRALYNQTVLDPAELRLTGTYYNNSVYMNKLFLQGRRVLAFSYEQFGFQLVHLCDITDAYLNAYRLAGKAVLFSLGVSAAAILLLYVLLWHSLRPLQALSEGAQAMAAGAYGQRVPEQRKDEIGELGRDFNKMAEAVEEHIREVEDSEEKKTLFMGSLTHELKTPLTAISGYAQTLRLVKLSDEDRETALGYICQESKRLDRLSKKMLRLMELDREGELDRAAVPLGALCEDAASTCAPAAKAKGVALSIGPCEGEWLGDRDLLTEAVVNLADNAVKASAPGQTVRLYTEDGALVVEDEGQGIPAEDLGRLTEPFYMVDKSRSRHSGGAGMGLALTAVILRRHGLTLHFESHLGAGTKASVFTI